MNNPQLQIDQVFVKADSLFNKNVRGQVLCGRLLEAVTKDNLVGTLPDKDVSYIRAAKDAAATTQEFYRGSVGANFTPFIVQEGIHGWIIKLAELHPAIFTPNVVVEVLMHGMMHR